MWPGQDALGQRFENHTVVGIAGSARQTALQDPDAVEGYFPAGANDSPALTLLVKAANRAEDLSASIAGVARSIDPALVPEIRLLKASFRDKVQETRADRAGGRPARHQRAGPRVRGDRRPGGVFGGPAHQGNRHPDGTRRLRSAGGVERFWVSCHDRLPPGWSPDCSRRRCCRACSAASSTA